MLHTPVVLFPAHQAASASFLDLLVTPQVTWDNSIPAFMRVAQLSPGVHFSPSD